MAKTFSCAEQIVAEESKTIRLARTPYLLVNLNFYASLNKTLPENFRSLVSNGLQTLGADKVKLHILLLWNTP